LSLPLPMCTSHPTAIATWFLVKRRSAFVTHIRVFQQHDLLQIEDMNSQAQLSAAQQLAASGGGGATNLEESGAGGDDDDENDMPELEAPEEDGPLDETGVDPKDIDLVMAQVRPLLAIYSPLIVSNRSIALEQKL
jgi:NACalpha-BTF3-like transcription factor